ncbi:phosphatidic acid phosphatase type 2 domain containing protein 1B, putative [Entamoeba invadens IP1]|uniref:Phosphatidic acid phosphatase type 2 domain containing protein 1B, putative n=2 Tax=Entamoeba invadens TaxID=33085 RepID=A0A0A1U1T0_ENTIV|nr:phosphatidic acid phosphatase type 2 domain containing protein 1B, putative [Entamoeba invadens IP1]ELP87979.1 phosphatidic acid phosphatase type 2 domain containing protein 1B, putative [Entamoeba invadens IP1]BAN40207.1 phosphatidic acid phosphatase type 2 domain-containing protein 1B, putative [Entamoeba invadens]|eukprot:XP_004254750.1 phosphatidic acid phosphatase type 2 domain containing protein 1B, putative [Entamoeba invadens IP1]
MNKYLVLFLSIVYDLIYIVFTGILVIVFSVVHGFRMEVPDLSENPNVTYPYIPPTFSTVVAGIVAYLPTIILILIVELRRLSLRHLIFSFLSLVAAILTAFMFVQGGKIYAGRPRPNMYELVARGDERDAWKSFPSGHSAASFNGFGYFSLYVAGELRVFSDKPEMWRLIPVIVPFILAGIIVISRTRDYYHNFSDIIAGSIIGLFSAIIGYFAKFASLTSAKSGDIKGPKYDDDQKDGDVELKDEELHQDN